MWHGVSQPLLVCWHSFVKTNVFLPGQLSIGDGATPTIARDGATAENSLGTECFVFLQKANAQRRIA